MGGRVEWHTAMISPQSTVVYDLHQRLGRRDHEYRYRSLLTTQRLGRRNHEYRYRSLLTTPRLGRRDHEYRYRSLLTTPRHLVK